MDSTKKLLLTAFVAFIATLSFSQITEGKIVYERRTNLKKTMGSNPRFSQFINDDNKIRKEYFELAFNDSTSVFKHIEEENPEEGMLQYFTQRNTVYQDFTADEFMVVLSSWGDPMYLQDSMTTRTWKVTESKRKFADYWGYKSIWEMNDSTRIYAWFCPDIVPSTGPEGFSGLPGAILGLATEDGSIVYFATEVKAVAVPDELTDYSKFKKDSYTKEELTEILLTNMGKWIKKKDLEAMLSWY